jgi:hypothetical protein
MLTSKQMGEKWTIRGYWLMWNVVELFQIGVPGDWVVDLDRAELVVKMLTRSPQLGSNRVLGAPDQRSLRRTIVV